ncbi:homeobox domain-containing protein [Cytidiella melzeri]|nr:homeobox domain-containing protein [Cytidiella melzeri]
MRPPTRTTRATRAIDEDEADFAVNHSRRSVQPGSNQSSRTGTPMSDREKKPRHRMTDKQLERLEALYQEDTHPTREQKQALGDDVGMDTRTVTVWFQNRRQLAKKQSLIVNSTQPMCRLPLSSVPRRENRQTSVSSMSQSSSFGRVSPQPYIVSRQIKRELWEHLPSASPSMPASATTSAMPSPLAKKSSRAYLEADKENTSTKRKPILEWACPKVAKRQRLQPKDDLDLGGDETEDEEHDDTLVDVDPNLPFKKIDESVELDRGQRMSSSGSLESVAIPPEYRAKFDDDVVLGASLLLAFTYSARS